LFIVLRLSLAARPFAARCGARAIQEQSKDEQDEVYAALVTEEKQTAIR
jgi:hypothetical protein